MENILKITAFTASLHQRNRPANGFRGRRDDGGSGDGRPSSRMMAVAHLPHDGDRAFASSGCSPRLAMRALARVGPRQPPAFSVDAHHHFHSSAMPAPNFFFSSAAFRSSATLSASAAASRSAGATSFRP